MIKRNKASSVVDKLFLFFVTVFVNGEGLVVGPTTNFKCTLLVLY